MKLANTLFVSVLVITGLLMAPVNCMCGASIPHGHSLFQLPFHNHSSASHASVGSEGHGHAGTGVAAMSMMLQEDECDDGGRKTHLHAGAPGYTALSNAIEKQDGAVLHAPPNSSIGQPIAIMQPALVALAGQQSESLSLPPARVLEGLDPSPEIPPPRFTTSA